MEMMMKLPWRASLQGDGFPCVESFFSLRSLILLPFLLLPLRNDVFFLKIVYVHCSNLCRCVCVLLRASSPWLWKNQEISALLLFFLPTQAKEILFCVSIWEEMRAKLLSMLSVVPYVPREREREAFQHAHL